MRKQISKKEFIGLLEKARNSEIYFDNVNDKLYAIGFYGCGDDVWPKMYYFIKVSNKVLNCVNGFVLRNKLENNSFYIYEFGWETKSDFFKGLQKDISSSDLVELVLK